MSRESDSLRRLLQKEELRYEAILTEFTAVCDQLATEKAETALRVEWWKAACRDAEAAEAELVTLRAQLRTEEREHGRNLEAFVEATKELQAHKDAEVRAIGLLTSDMVTPPLAHAFGTAESLIVVARAVIEDKVTLRAQLVQREQELTEARKTNADLNRRCQQAASRAKLNAADTQSERIAVRDAHIDALEAQLAQREQELAAICPRKGIAAEVRGLMRDNERLTMKDRAGIPAGGNED